MKKILKTIFFAFCLITISSCEEDIDPKVVANGFALRGLDSASPLVLAPQNDDNAVISLEWDKSDNGGFNTVSGYTVEVAESGTNFANAVTANAGNSITATDRTYLLKVGELNTLVNKLPGYQCGQSMDVDIRVKSTLGGEFYNAFTQYSTNVVTVTVTPYSSALPTLAFASSATITDDTPRLAASGVLNSDYEGYMYLAAGSYKFYKPDACGNYSTPVVYGDDDSGSFDTLTENGSGYVVLVPGYFLVKANLPAGGPLTYNVRPTTWNLFGAAKQNFPLANSPMTYNQTSKVWELNINLAEGYEFKFRSNLNTLVLGKYNVNSVGTSTFGGDVMTYNGGDFNVPGNKANPKVYKNFHITLDLSKPRNYNYTITVNP